MAGSIISLLNSLPDGQSVANCLQVRTNEHGEGTGSSYTHSFIHTLLCLYDLEVFHGPGDIKGVF